MRHLFTRLFSLLIFLSVFVPGAKAEDSDVVNCNRAFKIVVLGSSTAFGTGATTYDSSWVGRFTAYVKRKNVQNEVYNLGIPGFTTYNNLRPIGYTPPPGRPSPVSGFTITDALALQPDAIIINMPSNDAINNYTLTEQQANFEAAVALADAANIPVWVTTTQPRNFLNSAQYSNLFAMRDWINNRFAEKAVDYFSTVANPDGSINATYDFDAVHVNNLGHKLFYTRTIAETILDTLCIRYDIPEIKARAGADQNLTLPTNQTTLNGSLSSSLNGTITSYTWTKLSGPASATITNPNQAVTTVTNFIEGRYSFQLTVVDNNNLVDSDIIDVVVSNRVLIDFGPDATASPDANGRYWNNIANGLPGVKLTNAITVGNTLSTIGVEVINRIDGTFNINGPGANTGNTTGAVGEYPATSTADFAFAHPTATNGQWKITGLNANRQYRIKFWGARSDIGDSRIIEIKRADQLSPWLEYDGTNNNNFENAAVFLINGKSEMTFDIRVKSGSAFGYIGLIDISYTTAPDVGNLAPVARAGNDQIVSLPNTSTTLDGSTSSDDDGNIESYEWTKISGPNNFTIVSPNSAITQVTNLEIGEYTFVLRVTDNEAATGTDTIKIIVNERVLIDFGPTATAAPDANGNYWNEVVNGLPGVKLANAISTGNSPTGISLEIINRIDGTFNIGGPGSNTGNTVGAVQEYVESATTDYVFGHPSATNGLWKISGLNPAKQYVIKFWGNRSVADERVIEIKRTDESTWKSYNGANNADYNRAAVFTLTGLSEMSFDIRVPATSAFGYINIIDISITVPILPCSPAITVTANPSTPVCSGSPVTFSTNIFNGGPNPLYQWKRNGVNINGATADTLLTTTLLNNDLITCELTSNFVCIGNNTVVSQPVQVSTLPIAPKLGNITGPTNICLFVGTANNATYTVPTVNNATTYNWVVPTGATIVSGQGTNTIQVSFSNSYPTADTIRVSAGPCTNSLPSRLVVSKVLPAIPGAVTGPTNVCAFVGQPVDIAYSIQPVESASSYIWTVPDGSTIVSGQGTTSINVRYLSTFTSGSIKVASVANCGSRSPRSVSVSGAKPGSPAAIIGPDNACAFIGTNTPVTYSVTPVANADSYFWTAPAGVTIVSGQGTSSINVVFELGYSTKSLKVRSVANCGSSSDRALSIFGFVPTTPGSINGPVNACTFIGTGEVATYRIAKVANATSYDWVVPNGAFITSHPAGLGVNDTIITVSFDFNFVSGSQITVRSGGCGFSAVRALSVLRSGVPSTPSSISGPANTCTFAGSGQTAFYSIAKVANASSYDWSVTSGATIVSHPAGLGANDTIVEVSFSNSFSSGSISVGSANGCGSNNTLRTLTLRNTVPSTTPTITGPTDPCLWIGTPGAVYTIRKIANATSYTWTVPAIGATAVHPNGPGENDTVIVVTFTPEFTTGSITARADAVCGSSSTRSFTLTRKMPSTPGLMTTTLLSACPNRQYSYSVPALPANATSITWEVPVGATIVSGHGTTSIIVSYQSAATTGSVRVFGTNNCGNSSSARSATINLPSCPTLPRGNGQETKGTDNLPFTKAIGMSSDLANIEVTVMPNPTQSQFKMIVQSTDMKLPLSMKVYDVNGRVLEARNVVQPGQLITVGAAYTKGFYIAEFVQGNMRKQVKLIKQ